MHIVRFAQFEHHVTSVTIVVLVIHLAKLFVHPLLEYKIK